MQTFDIETGHGRIAVTQSRDEGPVALMIHGNSSCKEVFARQMTGPLGTRYRLMALDLPGHGASADAADAARTYSLGGYAETAVETLEKLGVKRAKVFGWSLGGHIGLEMISRFAGLEALMIVGTPPVRVTPEGIGAGFVASAELALAGQETLSEQEVYDFARTTCGVHLPVDPHLLAMCARTDGRARKYMFESFAAGRALDEVDIVMQSTTPIAVLNGADEPFVNLAYLNGLTYGSLWEGVLFVVPGVGHACFWEAPAVFDPVFERFLG